jgi:hypothetical protein
MGDRGNIQISQPLVGTATGEASVFFYTHWRGSEVCQVLAKALDDNRETWGDPDYLARIIFNELQGDDRSNKGFGIGTCEIDPEHPTPEVYWTTRTSRFDTQIPNELMVQYNGDMMTGDEFVNLKLPPVQQVAQVQS